MDQSVRTLPDVGSVWKHHSGRLYRVLMITNYATTKPEQYPVSVVYEGQNGFKWSGTLDDWHRRMTLLPFDPFGLFPSNKSF